MFSSASACPLSSLPPPGPLVFVAASAGPVAALAVPVAASAASGTLFHPFDVASAPPGVAPSLLRLSRSVACGLRFRSLVLRSHVSWLHLFRGLSVGLHSTLLLRVLRLPLLPRLPSRLVTTLIRVSLTRSSGA